MENFDIVALGESLMDFVTIAGPDKDKIYMEGNAGGAPANVLAMATKLGCTSAFIGKVGRDSFGQFLLQQIRNTGVDTSAMIQARQPTTLAMVSLDETGNRSFAFYRNQTADVMLTQLEVDMDKIENCKIFHFGTVSMVAQPAADTTAFAAEKAKAAGALISFDPNYRPLLWEEEESAIRAMEAGLELANYVKMSDEEAFLLTGDQDPERAAAKLQSRYGFDLLCVTLGPKGCVAMTQDARVMQPTYDVKTKDTTGAGDAFWGAVLSRLIKDKSQEPWSEKKLRDILNYGNAAGSLTTTGFGAIAPQPSHKEIIECIKETAFL